MTNKERILAAQEAAEKLKVYKARLESGDGWQFICAKNKKLAVRIAASIAGVNAEIVVAATPSDLQTIAVRALEGLG